MFSYAHMSKLDPIVILDHLAALEVAHLGGIGGNFPGKENAASLCMWKYKNY